MATEGSSIIPEEESYIVATNQQTRFHVGVTRRSAEVDIKDLNISIVSSKAKKSKGKGKGVGSEVELLTGAELRLKAGTCYGLLGRNGTGKSTLLRAMAEKLIPGLPPDTRIALLQQTSTHEQESTTDCRSTQGIQSDSSANSANKTVLQQVIESDVSRNIVLQDLKVLSVENESDDTLAQIRAYRQVRHNRLQREFLLVQNNASLRSRERGLQARKELLAFEKKVEESKALLDQNLESVESSKVQEELQEASDLLTDLQNQMTSLSLTEMEEKARHVLLGLGFQESSFQTPFNTLSGGWRMRCMLAGVLIQDVEILILDEPTNFLDLLSIIWLQEYLISLRSNEEKTVIVVSHDRDFMDNICEELILLRDQKLSYFRGNIASWEKDFRSRVLYLTRMQEVQDKEAARLAKTISANIKIGKKTGDDNKLRMAKSRQKKLDEGVGMQVNARGGRFKLSRDRAGWQESRLAAIDIPTSQQSISIILPLAPDLRFPGPLISLEKISYKYTPKSDFVLQGIDLSVSMGDRIGIVGLNGCGKSTLIKVITDNVKATRGTVTTHPRIRLGYYSQQAVEDLQALGRADLSRTALNMIAADAGDEMNEQDIRGLLGSFGLHGHTASDVPVTKLSGGQLVRLALVRILWNHPNLLVLDEVTTHLDFDTVTALAEALMDYNGALIVVSHDRFLIRRVVEGERVENSDDENDAGKEEELEKRRRTVHLLRAGVLKEQSSGVAQFEKSLEKRLAKMFK